MFDSHYLVFDLFQLNAGNGNLEGSLTTRKYTGIIKIGRRTSVREINDLLNEGMLKQNEGEGRSVSYELS